MTMVGNLDGWLAVFSFLQKCIKILLVYMRVITGMQGAEARLLDNGTAQSRKWFVTSQNWQAHIKPFKASLQKMAANEAVSVEGLLSVSLGIADLMTVA